MPQLCSHTKCSGCTACVSVCPKHSITMAVETDGFSYPSINNETCIECGLCTKVCPVLNHPEPLASPPRAYAAACTEEEIRSASTSGGVFTLLARWVFAHGGVVFGASYGKDFSVIHCGVETEAELWKLRTAKYAQSDLESVFSQVRVLLTAGRFVLFSGTPCQTSGLCSYLQKPYPNLIVADLICHGVPSPSVWQEYIRYRRQNDAQGASIKTVNLRSKETGWPGYSIRFEYDNGTAYTAQNAQDPFLRAFVGNLCLRPSCYNCSFKGLSRNSDFTLADYWGVWNQLPEYNDGKGTSLVLIHSQRGEQIWQELQSSLRCREIDPMGSVEENPSALVSPEVPEKRADFMARYLSEPFGPLVDELRPVPPQPQPPSGVRRYAKAIKHLVKKILS